MKKEMNAEWLEQAVAAIKSGLCEKFEKGNISVYKCGKIIRVDIKDAFSDRSLENHE